MASYTFYPDQKIMEVDAPATEVTITELIAIIAAKMRELTWMDEDEIAVWEGKGELFETGQYTGKTLTFINDWRLKWADRSGPEWVTTLVSGGNLLARKRPTAINLIGEKQYPLAPATYVMPTIAQAVSPTYTEAQANKQILVSLAGYTGTTHFATGDLYYVDPVYGNDNWSGTMPEWKTGTLIGPKKTFAAAKALCQQSHHDAIYLVQSNIGSASILNENIVLDVEDMCVFGPGAGFIVRPTNPSIPTIRVTADHVMVRAFTVEGDNVTSVLAGLQVDASTFLAEMMFVRNVNGNGLYMNGNASMYRIVGGFYSGCTEAGIAIDGSSTGVIHGYDGDFFITGNKYGINFLDQTPEIDTNCEIRDITVYGNSLGGIRVGAGSKNVSMLNSIHFMSHNGTLQPGGPSEQYNILSYELSTDVEPRTEDVIDDVSEVFDGTLRVLGLLHENAFIDNTVYDGNGQITSARIRVFDTKANADLATDGGSETTGLLETYSAETEWESLNRMRSYRLTRE